MEVIELIAYGVLAILLLGAFNRLLPKLRTATATDEEKVALPGVI